MKNQEDKEAIIITLGSIIGLVVFVIIMFKIYN